MSFEIRKLTSFPMEKLYYYYLKLEVLEEMEPDAAIELVKVNAGFRSILLRKSWIVFGRHVQEIYFGSRGMGITKLPGPFFFKPWLKADLHLPLIKRIHSCDTLVVELPDGPFSDEQATILGLLHSVKRLWLFVQRNDSLRKFLENFRSMIEDCATISLNVDLLKENQELSELFKNFIASQMNDCEEVSFISLSAAEFDFYNDVFVRTSIKCLVLSFMLRTDDFEEIVQSIVKRQIPSKNLMTAFYMYIPRSDEINARIVDFLSRFPGMKRLDGENQQEVSKMTTNLLNKLDVFNDDDLRDGVFFRRNIDARRDCVYMFLSETTSARFFAFYAQPRSEIMEL